MKNIKFASICLFLLASTFVNGQTTESVFTINKVAEKTWVIVENNEVNMYLVEGSDSALIIDTGNGKGDLKTFIRKYTKLPLIVVNTHGHGDHVANDHLFDKVYINLLDTDLFHWVYSKGMPKSLKLDAFKEGQIFDLGGRKIKVISVPGHTRGSMVLLDRENKILFAGDNSNQLVWLFLNESLPLEIYLATLQKLAAHINEFEIILPGHGTPLKNTFVNEQILCVKSILDGTCSPQPYKSQNISDRAMVCKFKTAEVSYDPQNLRVKK